MSAEQYALERHLLLMPDLPDPPPISWPNVDYKPNLSVTGFYLRVGFAPARPDQASLGPPGVGFMRHTGTFGIDVFTARNRGSALANQWADRIEQHFNEGTVIEPGGVNIHVVRCGRQAAREEADRFWIPVPVEYYCYRRI